MNNHLYSSHERLLDTVLGDADFWWAMSKCKDGEGWEHCQTSLSMFQWFLETYGIQLEWSDEYMGKLKSEVRIVDEQKYLMFLLKYMK